MMRAMIRLSAYTPLVMALALGCAQTPRPTTPPAPAPVATPPAEPAIAVRELPPPVFADPERRAKIAALLPTIREEVARIVADDGIVGLAVGVVVDGELVFGEGFGRRHAEQGGAVDTRTAFRIGSITKIFTAMTVLRLAAEGRLDLDDPAAKYLPELHTLVYPSGDARRVTIRDILTHSAGLPRNPDLPPHSAAYEPTRAEVMQAIDGLSLVRPPGVEYEYSNLGFVLLGHVITAASGKHYHEAIREAMLGPLGMQHTVWEPGEVAPERFAIGHAIKDGQVAVTASTRHGALDAAGGLLSSVEDLARFVAFQLDAWPPRSAGEERAPLSRTTLREAQRLQAFRSFSARTVPVELTEGGVEGSTLGVGMTWGVSHGCDHPYTVHHNGAVDGYHAVVSMLPHAGVGIIVLANSGWVDTGRVATAIQRALDGGKVLAPRAPQALPLLTETAARVVELLARRDAEAFLALGTQAMRQPSAAAGVVTDMGWLYEVLGACTLGPLKQATSPWSGVFPLQCERGRAELKLALTSATAPKIAGAEIAWLDGTPTPPVVEAAKAAVALLEKFDEAAFRARFSPAFSRAAVERLVTMMRFRHGACRLDRALEVHGPDAAVFALACERGGGRMTVGLDHGQPVRIGSFRINSTGLPPGCR